MMWKEYSRNYIKNNKASSISIVLAVLISALFISMITTVFYNMWADNIRRIIHEEGEWHGKLTGELSEQDIALIESHPNVEKVALKENQQGVKELLVYFQNPRTIYQELPELAEEIGLDTGRYSQAIQYHNLLLTEFYIFSPEEQKNPPLLLSFYIFFMLLVCISLILIIYHAFEMTGNERMHQLGILQSVGATPRQIRTVLIQESFMLSLLPILIGIVIGIGGCYGFLQAANYANEKLGREEASLAYHPLVFLITLCVCFITVWLAAEKAARRLSKVSALEAIRGAAGEPSTEKVRRYRLFSSLGVEWELTRKFLYVRRKAFRTSSLSLTISFLVFSIFLNFWALSELNTKYTYFERYKDTWDLMITVKGQTSMDEGLLADLRKMDGVLDCIGYQKAHAFTLLNEDVISVDLKSMGGLDALKDTGIEKRGDQYLINVPFVILDDESYTDFCQDVNLNRSAEGGVTVNKIWDNIHSHFREKEYLPYIREENQRLAVFASESEDLMEQDKIQVELNSFTDKIPDLREEYTDFSLVQIMPENKYVELSKSIPVNEAYYKIRTISEGKIAEVEKQVDKVLDGTYEYELENRKEVEEYEVVARWGYRLIVGGLCGLLACIGITNVFANTVGGIFLRKREFARYLSIGFTPGGLAKILAIEGGIIGLKPILYSLPINILFVIFMINQSEFLYRDYFSVMPLAPLIIFAGLMLLAVGLAYYIAGRKICTTDIVEGLKDDTMY